MLGLDKYFESKTLLYSAGAAAFLVAALLVLFILRFAFARRLHMPGGGRARQPRLGIVDAFDLDRQRQLVLVRRDNVEHLVMIGGPNDILIESQIVRAEARDMPRQRDKEPTVAPLNWPAGNAPALSPSVAGEPRLLPEDSAAAAQDMTPETAPSLGRAPAAPVKAPVAVTPPSARPPFLPLPPRRPITTPSFSFKPGPRPAGDPAPGSSAENGQALPTPVVSTLPPLKTPAAPPARAPRPQPQTAGPLPPSPLANPLAPNPLASPPLASPLAPPVTPARPVENEPSVAPVIVSPQELPPESPPKTIDPIESLEEEMAKLLGRDPKEL